jgi:hypothetical protein
MIDLLEDTLVEVDNVDELALLFSPLQSVGQSLLCKIEVVWLPYTQSKDQNRKIKAKAKMAVSYLDVQLGRSFAS